MRTSLQKFGPLERRSALEAALIRMMAHPEHLRPFVVLEHRTSQCFVQFAGSQTKPLLFDVPALGISLELGSQGDPSLYTDAVCLAFQTLASLAYSTARETEQLAALDGGHLVLVESPGVNDARSRREVS